MLGSRLPVVPGSVATGAAVALVRPEWLRVRPDPEAAWRVAAVSFLGADCRVQVAGPDGERLTASVPGESAAVLLLGAAVDVTVSPSARVRAAGLSARNGGDLRQAVSRRSAAQAPNCQSLRTSG